MSTVENIRHYPIEGWIHAPEQGRMTAHPITTAVAVLRDGAWTVVDYLYEVNGKSCPATARVRNARLTNQLVAFSVSPIVSFNYTQFVGRTPAYTIQEA